MSKNENAKNEAEKIVISKAKVNESVWLQFTGLEDVPELIKMTGMKPRVDVDDDGNVSLRIRKYFLNPPCLVNTDNVGNIQQVLTLEEFEKGYDIVKTKQYTDSFNAKN